MICVSLAEKTAGAARAAALRHDFAEIRLDAVSGLTRDSVQMIFAGHPRLIAAFRPGRVPEPRRLELLTSGVASGAAYVDVEIDAPPSSLRDIIVSARARRCRPIVSFHDPSGTPTRAVLEDIRRRGFDQGAEIVKIACFSGGPADNARLMGLLDFPKPVIAVGMGSAGRITRLVGPLLGAPFTYASPAAGRETAPGQIEAERIRRTWEAWRND
ncbi:MAG: type I 3-dehydroquinate dehydratase [Acidobacteriota bacterium]|nr:type I 3-dehydroquinate dehydratase [Acidobacteriota bacterium]MDD8039639.1 type I 3-dehydroquinate dehydratase [Acidobacteriota bacterium]